MFWPKNGRQSVVEEGTQMGKFPKYGVGIVNERRKEKCRLLVDSCLSGRVKSLSIG
jgi:hypothetical protein